MSDRFLGAGIPFLYFVLLRTNRDGIAPTVGAPEDQIARQQWQRKQRETNGRVAHLRFLFDGYEPRFMYFEIAECARKLLLTGMLVFFFPETPSQVRVIAKSSHASHVHAL